MTEDITLLLSAADDWETAEYVFAVVAVLAIALESWELAKLARKGQLGDRIVEAIAVVFVIIALVGELVATAMSNNRTGLVIALLNKQSEADRLARMKIEEKLKWRSLSFAQSEKMRIRLTPFSGTKWDAMLLPAAPDGRELFVEIFRVLEGAHWVRTLADNEMGDPPTQIAATTSPDIIVLINKDEDAAVSKAAAELAAALTDAGIPATPAVNGNAKLTIEPHTILISVGLKSDR